jgi:transposase
MVIAERQKGAAMQTNVTVASGGMDVHYKFSTVTFLDAESNLVRRERLDHPDREKLRERLSRWPKGVPIVLEASFGWGWISDLMEEVGLEPHLSNCYKVEQMRKARGLVKTNTKDSSLSALLPFERTNWWEVWRAPREVRNRREQTRYRSDLVGLQTMVKNRIHSIFHRHGIFYEHADLFGGPGRKFLIDLCQNGSPYLSVEALGVLRGQVRLLDHVRGQLADEMRTHRRHLEKTPLIRLLKSIDGFGLVLSNILAAEIGRIERFGHHRALASYCLLAPQANDTGEPEDRTPLGRHLGTRGNRTLKWVFIEAAHGAVRSGGKWRAMFDRVTNNGRENRNRGYIKVARELVKIVYVVWKKQVPYTDTPPVRPGQDQKKRPTRSGTGQLYHPMVQA